MSGRETGEGVMVRQDISLQGGQGSRGGGKKIVLSSIYPYNNSVR